LIAPRDIPSDVDGTIQDAYKVMKNIMEDPAKREEYISAKLKEAELEREFEVCEEKGKAKDKIEGIKEGQVSLLVSSIKEKHISHDMLVTFFSPTFSDLQITTVKKYITENSDANNETVVEHALKLIGESSHEHIS